jgi:hypothetical protein
MILKKEGGEEEECGGGGGEKTAQSRWEENVKQSSKNKEGKVLKKKNKITN